MRIAILDDIFQKCLIKRISAFRKANVDLTKYLSFDAAKRLQSEMVKVLNVAEKNDAAKSIAELMSNGRSRRREGRSVYNKIYEYEFNVFNQRCNMIMTSVSGHLLDLEFAGSYRKWQACNPVALFEAPVLLSCQENFVNIKETLEREVRNCSHLIIWTDCDREGENIGFEVIEVCKKVKPSIRVHRAKFSEITQQAVTRAINNLIPPDQRISDAVNVRRELDLRIGAAFTRFQTLRLQRVFPEVLSNQLISYGSCQFPTLGFVVDRYKQVQAFIPEAFWKIKVTHKKDETITEFSWKRGRLFEHTACLVLYQMCLEEPTAKVIDVRSRPKNKWRPQPLDTVELEKTASRKLHIGAKEALNIAEKLYTKGFISYPRTETTIFPKELDLVNLVQMQTGDPNWGDFASRVLENGPNPRQGTKTDNAHPPIHPIKYTSTLQGNERKIYEFVVRRFLACVSKDAEGFETTVEIEIRSERFAVNGLMIIAKNYLEVYPYEKWNAKEIGMYQVGETFQPTTLEMNESATSAPDLLSEADLIALMEKHGIGTDATHAEHIETIKSRLYVGVNENSRFVPGELGMGLVEGYDLMGFHMSKPHLRAELEADLKRICDGHKDPQVVLREQVAKYKEYFIEAGQQASKIDEALSAYFQLAPAQAPETTYNATPVMKCPKCNSGEVVLKTKRDGRGFYLSCMSYPQCNAVIWLPDSIEQVSATGEVCNECVPGPIVKLKFKVKRGAFLPFFEDEFIGCIGGCDVNLMEVMNIRPLTSGIQNSTTTTTATTTTNNNNLRAHRNSDSGYSTNQSTDFSQNSRNNRTTNQNNSRNSWPTGGLGQGFHSSPTSTSSTVSGNTRSSSYNNNNNNRGDHTDAENEIVCSCSQPAVRLTVRKEGPNKGRLFYKCATSQCTFFLWGDEGEERASDPPRPSNLPQATPQRSYSTNDATEVVLCGCGDPARILVVNKEGANKGRKFYSCTKPRGNDSCNFFQWASDDAVPSTSTAATGFRQSQKRQVKSEGGTSKRKCGLCSEVGHNRKSCPLN